MRKAFIIIVVIAFSGFIATFLAFRADVPAPDSVAIHFAMQTAMESTSAQEAATIQADFLTEAFEEMDMVRRSRDHTLQIAMYLTIGVFVVAGVLLSLYYEQRVVKPFRKLQHLAGRIAAGNLDIPLEMDRNNLFGAFTESFDLLREELRTAKENEFRANQSKKELVASLSHDIRTPVASIQSSMELLLVKTRDEQEKATFHSINKKLEQIDDLVTNMFHATLEELQVLGVTPIEIVSTEVSDLMHNADYQGRVAPFSIPSCLVLADTMRLQQVFDNIISNSYKYADTNIVICGFIDEQYLVIDIQDFGAGVPEEELPLLFNKFYRGTNTEASKGYGLGLYISKFFMTQMSGGIDCENRGGGFLVRLLLRLA